MTYFSRPSAGYTPTSFTDNKTKYQDDSAATPKVAISSTKVDGDFNAIGDKLNDLDSRLSPVEDLGDPVSDLTATTITATDVLAFADVSDSNTLKRDTVQGILDIAATNAQTADITGGSITGITDLAVADGGTGASTVADARTNLGVALGAHISGLKITNNATTPNSKIDVTADSAVLVDSDGAAVGFTSVSLTIDCGTTGANGLDTGSLGNSTWYALYLISDGTNIKGLASTSGTAPTMPSGYTYIKRVGWFRTNGSANFYRLLQYGNRTQYVVDGTILTDLLRPVGGNQASWFGISVSSYVPSTASTFIGIGTNWLSLGGTAGTTICAPNNNYPTNMAPLHIVANDAKWQEFSILLESTTIYYQGSNSNSAIAVLGWLDNL